MNPVFAKLLIITMAFNGIDLAQHDGASTRPAPATRPAAVVNVATTRPAVVVAPPPASTRPAVAKPTVVVTHMAPLPSVTKTFAIPAQPAPIATATLPTTRISAPIPTTAGQYRYRFYTTIDDKPADLCLVFSVSKKIAATTGRLPVLLFLGGMGDRGSDGNGVFHNGPPAEMMRHQELNDSLPLLVVSPQCPANRQWAEPAIAHAIIQIVAILAADPRIDPDRIYVGGFSMGGTGTWAIADAGPQYFAAIQPIAPREFNVETCSQNIENLPTWIICGDNDPVFFRGSLSMLGFLRKEGADVTLSVVPGAGHNEWQRIYPKLEYYNWFLAHTRAKPPAEEFADADLLKIASAPIIDPITMRVTKDFGVFAPYWQISNFGVLGNPGLKPDINGHKNVFVIRPLNAQLNCIMETTYTIPADKHGKLAISAGFDGQTDWNLTVNVADHDVLTTSIDKSTTAEGWYETTVDLAKFTGKSVHIDVMISPGKQGPGPVYFNKLAVEMQ